MVLLRVGLSLPMWNHSERPTALLRDPQDDVRDLMTAGGRTQRGFALFRRRSRAIARHAGDDLDDGLAAFDVAFAVIQDPVRRERRRVQLRVVEVEREKIPRLEIFNLRTVLPITRPRRG